MMHQKRILAGALGCLLICSQSSGYMAAAQQIPQTQMINQQTEENAVEIDRQENAENIINAQDLESSENDVKPEKAAGSDYGEKPEDDTKSGYGREPEKAAESGNVEEPENNTGSIQLPEQLEPDLNDPDYVKMLWMQENMENDAQNTDTFSLRVNSKVTKSPFTGLSYTHAAHLSDSRIVHGIDVSKWQADIDWKKVKAAGVKYVFIRCGYTSLSAKFAMYEDPYFVQNIKGAYNAGIEVGIYFFTNSITVKEAQKEAEKTLEIIDDYKHMITLPVVYDYEAFSNAYRAYGTPKEQVTKNAFAYMETIQGAGYKPMYYGSPNFLASSFEVSKLTDYDCWLANYTTKTSYTGDYIYWQYSSTGRVDGIAGNVDCNFYYDISEEETPEQPEVVSGLGPVTGLKMSDHTDSSITIKWNRLKEAAGYKIYRSKSYGGDYKQLKVINENTVTEFTDSTVMESEGRQYFYKVVPYILEEKNTEDNTGNKPGTEDNTGDNTQNDTQNPISEDTSSGGDQTGTQTSGTEDVSGTDSASGTVDAGGTDSALETGTSGTVDAGTDSALGTGTSGTVDVSGSNAGALGTAAGSRAGMNDVSGDEGSAGLKIKSAAESEMETESGTGSETEMGTDSKSGASDTDSVTKETVMKYGAESKILTAYTKRTHSFGLKTTTNLNLREHAGTEYPSIAVVPSGTELKYYKYTLSTLDKKWYKVTYKANGKTYSGYLSGSYVNLYTYGKTSKKVNMRSGAGLGYKVSRAVPKGTKVTILSNKWDEKGTKWSKIRYKKNGTTYTGFVPAKYLKQV